MAYPDYQIALPFLTSLGGTTLKCLSTGTKGWIFVGPMQYTVKRVAIQPCLTGAYATGFTASFRTITGCAASGSYIASTTGGQFTTIRFASGKAVQKGGMYFNDSFTPKVVKPGYTLAVAVTTTKTTGKGFRAWAMLEPSYERLQNTVTSTGKGYVTVTA